MIEVLNHYYHPREPGIDNWQMNGYFFLKIGTGASEEEPSYHFSAGVD